MPHASDTKSPRPADVHVGHRIKMRRLMLSISQSRLAEGLGVTFQQVQKYEKGGNRVSASRLFQLSEILQVPISFFFEEISTDVSQPGFKDSAAPLAAVLATRDGLALATAFSKIKDAKVRRAIVKIVEEIAQQTSGADRKRGPIAPPE